MHRLTIIITIAEGIDIFVKTPSGQWQIINYLAFPDKSWSENV